MIYYYRVKYKDGFCTKIQATNILRVWFKNKTFKLKHIITINTKGTFVLKLKDSIYETVEFFHPNYKAKDIKDLTV